MRDVHGHNDMVMMISRPTAEQPSTGNRFSWREGNDRTVYAKEEKLAEDGADSIRHHPRAARHDQGVPSSNLGAPTHIMLEEGAGFLSR